MVGPADIEHGEVQLQRGGEALGRIEIRGAETLTTSTKSIVKEGKMKILRNRFWRNSLFLLLLTGLLAGCIPHTRTILRSRAEDVVSVLDVDIVQEEHRFIFALWNEDAPASYITSTYVVSETPEEVKEKLWALHRAEDGWLAPSKDGWIGEVPLSVTYTGRVRSPEEVREDLRSRLLSERVSNILTLETDHLPEIDFFLICPWLKASSRQPDTYTTLYVNAVVYTNEGKLVIRIHTRGWSRCHDQNR